MCDLLAQGWVDRTSAINPGLGATPSMCYDPVNGYSVMVRTGFVAGTAVGETWTWDGATWINRGPCPAWLSGLTWHGATQQLIGLSKPAPGPTQQQSYTLHAWTVSGWATLSAPVTFPGNAPAGQLAAAYDEVRQETVFRGPSMPQAVVVYDGVTLLARGMISGPFFSGSESMAYDPTVQKVVLARDDFSNQLIGSTWVSLPTTRFYEWSGFGWNLRYTSAAPGRLGAMATDSQRQRIVLLDGDYPGTSTVGANQPYHTWTYSDGVATQLMTSVAPEPRAAAAMSYDSARGVVVLFGGSGAGGFADTWEFDLGPVASFTSFGAGCLGSRGVPAIGTQLGSLPRIGTTFSVQATNLPMVGPAFFILGFSSTSYGGSPLPLSLAPLGAPGCSLSVSADVLFPVANVLGIAQWSLTVPPIPGGQFFVQAVAFDPPANALGLTTSNAGHAVLGL
jgi:hypothetical protein